MEKIRMFAQELSSLKGFIGLCTILFLGSVGFGYTTDTLDAFLLSQTEALRDTAVRLEQMDNSQLWIFVFIFLNNFIKSVVIVFLGALFGIVPLVFIAMNGMLIGYVVALAGEAGAGVASIVIRGLLPHGVLEVTAILIASAYGVKYGTLVSKELAAAVRGRDGDGRGELSRFHSSLKRLVPFLFFALLAAAFIESTVTFYLVRGI